MKKILAVTIFFLILFINYNYLSAENLVCKDEKIIKLKLIKYFRANGADVKIQQNTHLKILKHLML